MPLSSKRERAFVGLFVLAAAGLLVATLFSLSGFFGRNQPQYLSYFNNAGGLAPGAEVRYAGGPPIGRIVSVRSDIKDPSRMEIKFRVDGDVPVKTDSKVKISSLGALGDNFLAIVPGTLAAPRAPSGSVLESETYESFQELTSQISELAPQAKLLLTNLNARVTQLQETLVRVNDLLNSSNRANISASLASVRGMLQEDRPTLHSTLDNLNASSAKLSPLIDDFRKTANQADTALSHLDATVSEDRPDLHQAIVNMRAALASASSLTAQLNRTVNMNSDNIDEIIANITAITENLQDFTQTIKTRPYTLIRATSPPPHKPGEVPKPQP